MNLTVNLVFTDVKFVFILKGLKDVQNAFIKGKLYLRLIENLAFLAKLYYPNKNYHKIVLFAMLASGKSFPRFLISICKNTHNFQQKILKL